MRWVTNRFWAKAPMLDTATWPGPTTSGSRISIRPRGSLDRCRLVHSRRLWLDSSAGPGGLRRDRSPSQGVIGFSDITALLNAISRLTGVVTFHGPVARASMPAFSRWHFELVLARAERCRAGWAASLSRPPYSCPKRTGSSRCAPVSPKGHWLGGNLTLAPMSDRHAVLS